MIVRNYCATRYRVLIIFTLIFQTVNTAELLSITGAVCMYEGILSQIVVPVVHFKPSEPNVSHPYIAECTVPSMHITLSYLCTRLKRREIGAQRGGRRHPAALARGRTKMSKRMNCLRAAVRMLAMTGSNSYSAFSAVQCIDPGRLWAERDYVLTQRTALWISRVNKPRQRDHDRPSAITVVI